MVADSIDFCCDNFCKDSAQHVERQAEISNSHTLDEAMNLTGFGKFNIIATFLCGLMLLGMILETLGFSYVIPACQCDLQLSLAEKGWLAAMPFLGIILTSHLWGYLADTRGRKKVLVSCMLVGAFFSILSSFSPDLVTFAALRFIAGIFIAGPSALGYAYLGELSPAKQRDCVLTLGNASVAFGTAIVPLVAWLVLPTEFRLQLSFLSATYRPWRLLVGLFSLPYICCVLLFYYLPESPKFLYSHARNQEALAVLSRIYSINSGKKTEEFPVTRLTSESSYLSAASKSSVGRQMWEQTVPLFRRPYLRHTLTTAMLQFANFAATNGTYIWLPVILSRLFEHADSSGHQLVIRNICDVLGPQLEVSAVHLNETDVDAMELCDDSLHTQTFHISIILACVVSAITVAAAFVIRCVGKRHLLMSIYLATGVCAFILYWLTDITEAVVSISIIQITGTCVGLVNAYVVEIFPTEIRAMAVCLTLMVGRVGSVAGANVFGYLLTRACSASFFTISAFLFGPFFLCLCLPKSSTATKTSDSQNGDPSTSRGHSNPVEISTTL